MMLFVVENFNSSNKTLIQKITLDIIFASR